MENIKYDVFLSRKSEDAHMAKEIYDFLTERGLKVFDSDISLNKMGTSEFRKAIDNALEICHHLIVIGSSLKNINSSWVQSEWDIFINEKRSGNKLGNILTVVSHEVSISSLDIGLRNVESIIYDKNNFERVYTYVEKSYHDFINVENKDVTENQLKIWRKQAEVCFKNKEYKESRQIYFRLAEHGDKNAQEQLAVIFEEGLGVEKDLDDAIYWYKKNADKGDLTAIIKLISLTKEDREKYIYWLQKASLKGYSIGQFHLGLELLKSEDLETRSNGLKWLENAAKTSYIPAIDKLGQYYEENGNVSEAFKWFINSSKLGSAFGDYKLAEFYKDGIGVNVDSTKAWEYAQKSAQKGNSDSFVLLGQLYANEEGNIFNWEAAEKCYLNAIEKGNNAAKYWLGLLYYDNGLAVNSQLRSAFDLFYQSHEEGYIPSTIKVGDCFYNGHGVDKDLSQSLKYFRIASKLGSKESQKKVSKINREIEANIGLQFKKELNEKEVNSDVKKDIKKTNPWHNLFYILLGLSYVFKIIQCSNRSDESNTVPVDYTIKLDSVVNAMKKDSKIGDSITDLYVESSQNAWAKSNLNNSNTAKKKLPKEKRIVVDYKVKEGEMWNAICGKFNNEIYPLNELNPEISFLSQDTIVKVYVQAIHTVGPGDILRVVANKYNISVEALMKANDKTEMYAERGEKLYIPLRKESLFEHFEN